ncbi:bifunctional serine/threonine-protein kinase/glutamate ABC transporter substrate-binding protein [Streptomyces uncialis]|uniref:bifunctional serine/threonine-protein kinase/glutamate ABC transporter substrate-binding protein n=1 Tax=Streptomyces uncialis TaxID=1048205 RepID=UPI00365234C7
MGLVWRARDLALNREVALKEVRPPDPALAEYDPEGARALRARVLREAQALALIDHPNVVTIHHIVDGGEHPYPWLVMELVTGGSFQERLDQGGPLTPVAAAGIGRGVLAGLRAVHAAGIQHRDIKPPNILLRPDGRPVLTDFGIAAIQGSTALTIAGSVIGTPDYMAPERVGGQDGGPAADLWSLALMLYVAVEGRHPLRRANTLATLAAVLSEDVPPPRRAGPLASALMAVLVRDPAARPDAEQLDELLAAAESGTTAVPRSPRGTPPGPAAQPDPDVVPGEPTSYALAPPERPAEPAGPPPSPSLSPSPSRREPSVVLSRPPGPPPSRDPRQTRRGRGFAYAALVAVPLVGVLVWNLLPDSGDDPDAAGGGRSTKSPQASGSSGAGQLTVGIKFDQPGFGERDQDGKFKGFDVDVATYIARHLGRDPADIVWKEAVGIERESMLKEQEVDLMVATYTMNESREEEIDFVGPYLVAHQDVLMSADNMAINRPYHLNGKKVCSVTGTSPGRALQNTVATRAVLVERPGYTQCLTDLANGTVDAVTTDDALLAGYAELNPGKYRLGGFKMTDERYGIGLPPNSLLKKRVQAALDKMIADGSWKKALTRNLPLLKRNSPTS